MGSLRAKQGSYIEILKAIQAGSLQGLTRPDRLLASQIWNTLNKMEYDPALKLYLPFDETSGVTAHDLSGNGNTGTATGTTIVDGVFGKARDFDGTDDYVDCGSGSSLNISGDITVEAWVKPAARSAFHDIVQAGSTHETNYSLYQRAEADKDFAFLVNPDGTYHTIKFGNYTAGTWWHVAGTWDGTTIKGLVNGVAYTPTPATLSKTRDYAGVQISSGRNLSPGYFDGIIDEVRIYSRALTADEIYLHYLAGALKLGLI